MHASFLFQYQKNKYKMFLIQLILFQARNILRHHSGRNCQVRFLTILKLVGIQGLQKTIVHQMLSTFTSFSLPSSLYCQDAKKLIHGWSCDFFWLRNKLLLADNLMTMLAYIHFIIIIIIITNKRIGIFSLQKTVLQMRPI